MRVALSRWLGLKAGEFGKTTGMFFYLMMAVGAFITGRITRDSLFLSRYDVSYLPYMYVWVAGVMVILGYAYSRVADRFRRDRLVMAVTTILLLLVCAARALLAFTGDWFYPILYVFVEVMGGLLVLQFWTFANDVFNTREAKRLFGLVGAGGVMATICAGFAVRGLARLVGTENLLFLCAALLVGCLIAVGALSRSFTRELVQSMAGSLPSKRGISLSADLGEIFSSRHLKVIAWMVLVTFVTITVVDYQFKIIARFTYLNREDQLSAFFGLFYGLAGVLSFFIQFLLTGRLMQRIGIVFCLLLLPVFLAAGSILVLLMPALVMVTFLKGADNVLRYTVNDAASQVLYLPVPGRIRGRAKAFIDTILKPAAQGITGLAIAWTAGLVAHRIQWMSVGTLLVIVAWVVLVLGLKKGYVRSLASSLRQRRIHFGATSLSISDSQAVEALQQTLADKDEQAVLHALEMVAHVKQRDWSTELGRLLDHESARVRVQALRLLERETFTPFLEQIQSRFHDPDEDVRAEAVSSYCSALKEKALGTVAPLLRDESIKVKAAAVVGLVRYGGLDGILAAAEVLKGLLDSAEPARRGTAAWIIGQVNVRTFYRSLLPLLMDPVASVRAEAVRAAGELKCPELTLPLIYRLSDPQVSRAAVYALGSYGPGLVTTLRTVMDNPKEDPAIRRAIPQVLARIDDQLSMDVLSNMLDWDEELLRSAALNAVVQLHLKNPGLRRDREKLRRALRRDLKDAYQLQAMAVELAPMDGDLLQENIQHRYEQGIERIFKLLRVLHPGRPLETIQRNLASPHSAIRANSLELLDNVLDTETRRCLLPLLEERDPASLAASGDALFPLLHLNAKQWLHRMLVSDHEWTVVCALETVGRLPDGAAFESSVRMLLKNSSPLVREAAAFCLKRLLAPESLAAAVSPLGDDPDPQVRAAIRFLAGPLPSTPE